MVRLIFAKIVYFLGYACRRRKMNKIVIFKFGFLELVKVSQTNRADFGIRITMGSSLSAF